MAEILKDKVKKPRKKKETIAEIVEAIQPVYYSLDNILTYKADYNIIFGERSNGKTFAVLERILKQFCESNYSKQGAIIRRWGEDFKGKRAHEMIAGLVAEDLVSKYSEGEYTTILYRSGAWYLAKYDDDLKKFVMSFEPMAYAFALSDVEHDKSTSYPNIKTILFDEFLTRTYYLNDEFVMFLNTLSTIIRRNDDVEIFMCGNTVNKSCPYFTEMGLKNVSKMKQDTIQLYTCDMNETVTNIAVEYCANITKGTKPSDKYFSFNNPKARMITDGTWEMAIYPHCPIKYGASDIKYTFFVKFEQEKLQCEIVKVGKESFIFIHMKTTEFKNPDTDHIFDTEVHMGKNYSRRITKPKNKVEELIASYFKQEKVFYQDNEVGEIMRNYLMWCQQTKMI